MSDADGSAGDLAPYRDEPYIRVKRRLAIRGLLPTVQVSVGGIVEVAKCGRVKNRGDSYDFSPIACLLRPKADLRSRTSRA